eukprot:COSAG06_NODE_846_length_11978_cov_4.785420_2_plen_110_part_00
MIHQTRFYVMILSVLHIRRSSDRFPGTRSTKEAVLISFSPHSYYGPGGGVRWHGEGAGPLESKGFARTMRVAVTTAAALLDDRLNVATGIPEVVRVTLELDRQVLRGLE